jgi:hypothetical protein
MGFLLFLGWLYMQPFPSCSPYGRYRLRGLFSFTLLPYFSLLLCFPFYAIKIGFRCMAACQKLITSITHMIWWTRKPLMVVFLCYLWLYCLTFNNGCQCEKNSTFQQTGCWKPLLNYSFFLFKTILE